MCVCILGHAEPQNWFDPDWLDPDWFDPGVGSGCIPIYLFKISFWDSYYIFWQKKKKKGGKSKPTFVF